MIGAFNTSCSHEQQRLSHWCASIEELLLSDRAVSVVDIFFNGHFLERWESLDPISQDHFILSTSILLLVDISVVPTL